MDVKQTIAGRRTAHLYLDEQIDRQTVMRSLELALTAPNHKLTFPWRFVVVGPKTRETLAERQVEAKRQKLDDPDDPQALTRLREKIRRKMIHPAALVAFCCRRSDDPFQAREDYASVACAIQNFCLALAGDGWDSKWSTGAISRDPTTYELLKVDAGEWEIIGFVWVGHSAVPLPDRRRPGLEEVMTETP